MQEEFSLLLKKARKEAGLTQKGLADILGVATGTVQQWELGMRFPRVAMLKRIEDTLKIAIIPSNIENEKKQKYREFLKKAWKAAEQKAGKKLSYEEAMEYFKFDVPTVMRLEDAISKLNNEGVRVALERIEELTLISKYTLPVVDSSKRYFDPEKYVLVSEQVAPSETLSADGEYTEDTAQKEKSPVDAETPTGGK